MTDIPPPFVGGTDSPRRSSDEDKAFQTPFSPTRDVAAEDEHASDGIEDAASQPQAEEEAGELFEEDLLPDMATEGEDIAVEGPMYDLEWPEGPDEETTTGPAAASDFEPYEPAEAVADEPPSGDEEVPQYLFGPDSVEPEVAIESEPEAAVEPPGTDRGESKQELVEMARRLQAGHLGESIRDLVAELNVYPPEIAVPRAFAAGYLAAREEKEK